MRLIDADALIAQMEADAEQMEITLFKMATYAAINDVKHQPTIEERKTGQWIQDETDNSIECNKCGCVIWANDIMNGDAYYCPNCGAKMEANYR